MKHLKGVGSRMKYTEESNEGKEINIGDNVIDIFCHEGSVIKIQKPKKLTIENHGWINVMQSDGRIEHYSYYGWNKMLKIR